MKLHAFAAAMIGIVAVFANTALGAPSTSPRLSFTEVIRNPDGDDSIDFGRAVAVSPDGETIAVSSFRDSEGGDDSGAVRLFDSAGNFLRKIPQVDGLAGAGMGMSIAWTDDGRLVVGGWSPGVEAPVYVFDLQGDLLHRIENPAPTGIGQFGIAVEAIGNDILVGSVFDDDLEDDAGAVYLFDENYQQVRRFVSPEQTPRGLLGRYIAVLDEETFVVGAYAESHEASETGRAYVFSIDGSEVSTLVNPNPLARDFFGIHVAKSGENVLVGAIQQAGAESGGLAYLFTPDGELLTTFENPNPDARDWFGYFVTSVGTHVAVGAPHDDTVAWRSGAVYLLDQEGALLQAILDPTPGDSGDFGKVFGVGDTLFASASYDDGAVGEDGPGAVFVYQLGLIPGDVDMDGAVDLRDFSALKTHFGQAVDARAMGDLTGDLFADLDDFSQLKENFGATAASATVPEPEALPLAAAFGLLLAGWCGRLTRNVY